MPVKPEPFRKRFLLAWQAYERIVGAKVDGQAFAKALGVSRPLVSAWQEAESPPPHERILMIAAITGVDPGWLAYGRSTEAHAMQETGGPVVKRTRGKLLDPEKAARSAAAEEAEEKGAGKRRA